jgi:hypothetical protein
MLLFCEAASMTVTKMTPPAASTTRPPSPLLHPTGETLRFVKKVLRVWLGCIGVCELTGS